MLQEVAIFGMHQVCLRKRTAEPWVLLRFSFSRFTAPYFSMSGRSGRCVDRIACTELMIGDGAAPSLVDNREICATMMTTTALMYCKYFKTDFNNQVCFANDGAVLLVAFRLSLIENPRCCSTLRRIVFRSWRDGVRSENSHGRQVGQCGEWIRF